MAESADKLAARISSDGALDEASRQVDFIDVCRILGKTDKADRTFNPRRQVNLSYEEAVQRLAMAEEQLKEKLGEKYIEPITPESRADIMARIADKAQQKQDQPTEPAATQPTAPDTATPKPTDLAGRIPPKQRGALPKVPAEERTAARVAAALTPYMGYDITPTDVLNVLSLPPGGERYSLDSDLGTIVVCLDESTRPVKDPDSLGAMLSAYRKAGLHGAYVDVVRGMFARMGLDVSGLNFSTRLTDMQRALFTDVLDTLLDIKLQVDQHATSALGWKLDYKVVNEFDDAGKPVAQDKWIVEYNGICGHPRRTPYQELMYRMSNANKRVGTYYEFCDSCMAPYIDLLTSTPDAAQPDSIHEICGDPVFATGAKGFIKSRTELWHNLKNGVLSVFSLVYRLTPDFQHRNYPKDQQLREQQRAQFRGNIEAYEREAALYNLDTAAAIQANQELKPSLIAKLKAEKKILRANYGLPERFSDYQQYRREHKLQPATDEFEEES